MIHSFITHAQQLKYFQPNVRVSFVFVFSLSLLSAATTAAWSAATFYLPPPPPITHCSLSSRNPVIGQASANHALPILASPLMQKHASLSLSSLYKGGVSPTNTTWMPSSNAFPHAFPRAHLKNISLLDMSLQKSKPLRLETNFNILYIYSPTSEHMPSSSILYIYYHM